MHSPCLGAASYATALYRGVQFEDLLLTYFMACRYTGKQSGAAGEMTQQADLQEPTQADIWLSSCELNQ
jgi:hypothetical protein